MSEIQSTIKPVSPWQEPSIEKIPAIHAAKPTSRATPRKTPSRNWGSTYTGLDVILRLEQLAGQNSQVSFEKATTAAQKREDKQSEADASAAEEAKWAARREWLETGGTLLLSAASVPVLVLTATTALSAGAIPLAVVAGTSALTTTASLLARVTSLASDSLIWYLDIASLSTGILCGAAGLTQAGRAVLATLPIPTVLSHMTTAFSITGSAMNVGAAVSNKQEQDHRADKMVKESRATCLVEELKRYFATAISYILAMHMTANAMQVIENSRQQACAV